jgi:hypothetical protein
LGVTFRQSAVFQQRNLDGIVVALNEYSIHRSTSTRLQRRHPQSRKSQIAAAAKALSGLYFITFRSEACPGGIRMRSITDKCDDSVLYPNPAAPSSLIPARENHRS